MLDPNPLFWKCWLQLGQAVACQAVRDYVRLQKKVHGYKVTDDKDGFIAKDEEIRKFFQSRYFSYICPRFDGYELYERLQNDGWRNIPRMHNHARPATYQVGDWGKYTGRPVGKRGPKAKPSRFGIKREGENGL